MLRKLFTATALVALACLNLFAPVPSKADGESPGCQTFANLSGEMTFSGFLGSFNYRMDNAPFNPGDFVTVTVAWAGTPIPAHFEVATLVVGAHPFALPLAGPVPIPGTLNYTYSGPVQVGGEPIQGLGFDLGTDNLGSSGTVNVTTSCTPASNAPGPGIPPGFTLHRITCTVAVYDSPGGTPVGSSVVIDGQTWFVSPEAITDRQGALWTEIFVGGIHDGFIPTRCVH